MKNKSTLLIDRLCIDILHNDNYFNELLDKIELQYADFFLNKKNINLEEKELYDLLKFADILSSSSKGDYINIGYKLITLLENKYQDNSAFKLFSKSILSKIGNYPALKLIKGSDDIDLPFEIEAKNVLKKTIQKTPDGKRIFTDIQYDIFQDIISKDDFSFSGPTSLGKSFLLLMLIRYLLSKKNKTNVIVVVPTRALITQVSIDIRTELENITIHNSFQVITNSNISEIDFSNQSNIFVLTPERLNSLLSLEEIPIFDLIFVDEAHKIFVENDIRSITEYSAIEHAIKKFPLIKIIFATPNVNNPGELLKLFRKNGELSVRTNQKLVSQNLFFIDLLENKNYYFSEYTNQKIEINTPTDFQSLNTLEVIQKLAKGEKSIIYCNGGHKAIQNALEFIDIVDSGTLNKENKGDSEIIKLQKNIAKIIHKDYYLIKCLEKRIAFHFGNLPQTIRIQIEDLYREGYLDYIFCTSTLLEGVNLPAKNVFILNNKKGPSKLTDIDFWNLAGRAGRLTKELSGNIICIKDNKQNWTEKDIQILEKNKPIELKNSPKDYLQKKKLEKIEELLKKGDYDKNEPKKKEVLKYIANIISIDTLLLPEGYTSPLVQKLIEDNKKEIIDLAKKNTEKIEIPHRILFSNKAISIKSQNIVYQYIKNNQRERVILGNQVTYDECIKQLELLSRMYNWDKEDKDINIKRIKYLALLMNKWINGENLSRIIQEGINFAHETKAKLWSYDKGKTGEFFNKNDIVYVNQKINEIIEDIEKLLRFSFEKYFNNYYLICVNVYGEENAGLNWATFLEYGTMNSTIISLQGIGLSRQASSFISQNYKNCIITKNGKFNSIDKVKLLKTIPTNNEYYQEISKVI